MKIRAIDMVKFNISASDNHDRKNRAVNLPKRFSAENILGCIPCYYPINFGAGGSDISKVRKLFQFGIPDMYSERITIDPKQLSRWMKGGLFLKPAPDVLKVFDHYSDSFIGNEANILALIRERSLVHPEKTLHSILQELKPVYGKMLRKEQNPVFHELWIKFQALPPEYKDKFDVLLEKTDKMLSHKPVVIPFSTYEFRYRLAKIYEYFSATTDMKAKRTLLKIMKEATKFENNTTPENLDYQKKVLMFINHIRKRSVLRANEQLKQLYMQSRSRLNQDEILVPFRRKSFIYDVLSIIDNLSDDVLKEDIIKTAQLLPTSSQSFPAYVMKCAAEPNEKIGYKIVWPSISTIEHLLPRSCGGLDLYSNIGIASAVENSDRKSIDFVEQLKRKPKTPIYVQRQADRLIQLANDGVFDVLNIDKNYIRDSYNTIYELSQHAVNPDLSALRI